MKFEISGKKEKRESMKAFDLFFTEPGEDKIEVLS